MWCTEWYLWCTEWYVWCRCFVSPSCDRQEEIHSGRDSSRPRQRAECPRQPRVRNCNCHCHCNCNCNCHCNCSYSRCTFTSIRVHCRCRFSPLAKAVAKSHTETIQLLLDRKADPNTQVLLLTAASVSLPSGSGERLQSHVNLRKAESIDQSPTY